jgi:hypothetical protein
LARRIRGTRRELERYEVNIMARSSNPYSRDVSGRRESREPRGNGRRVTMRRRAVRRELPPLDLRTPSGRSTLPY